MMNNKPFEFRREQDEIKSLFELGDKIMLDWKENTIKPNVTYFLLAISDMYEAVPWYDVSEYLGYDYQGCTSAEVQDILDKDDVAYELMFI